MSRQCVAPRCLSPTFGVKVKKGAVRQLCFLLAHSNICEVRLQMSINIVRICDMRLLPSSAQGKNFWWLVDQAAAAHFVWRGMVCLSTGQTSATMSRETLPMTSGSASNLAIFFAKLMIFLVQVPALLSHRR